MRRYVVLGVTVALLAAGCGRQPDQASSGGGPQAARQERVACQPGSTVVVDGQQVQCPAAGEILVVRTQAGSESERTPGTVEVPWWYFLVNLFHRDRVVVYEGRSAQAPAVQPGAAGAGHASSAGTAGTAKGPGLPDWVKAPAAGTEGAGSSRYTVRKVPVTSQPSPADVAESSSPVVKGRITLPSYSRDTRSSATSWRTVRPSSGFRAGGSSFGRRR